MLVVGRRIGEGIVIGDRIVVAVMEIHRGRVQLGVSAPAAMPIHREEIWKRIRHSLARQGEKFDRTSTLSALSRMSTRPVLQTHFSFPARPPTQHASTNTSTRSTRRR
jgi:carbon storage regulator